LEFGLAVMQVGEVLLVYPLCFGPVVCRQLSMAQRAFGASIV
jgi:hypothetical protein